MDLAGLPASTKGGAALSQKKGPAAGSGSGGNTEPQEHTTKSRSEQEAQLAERLFEEFRGREDNYAVATEAAFRPSKRPLTVDDILLHVQQQQCFGFYLMRPDDTVVVSAIDFDEKHESDWRERASSVADWLRGAGLEPIVEVSQSGAGAHVWLFFVEPVEAWLVRAFWRWVLIRSKVRCREIFPKQDRLDVDKPLGNLIRYPLWNKSGFVNEEWYHVEPLDALNEITRYCADDLRDLAAHAGAILQPDEPAEPSLKGELSHGVKFVISNDIDRQRWEGDASGLSDKSRSGIAMSFVCELVRRHIPTDAIKTALRLWCKKHGATDKGERDDWIDRTVSRAYDHVQKHSASSCDDSSKRAPKNECALAPAPPWRPFPVDVLPSPIREFIQVVSKSIRCDPSFVALPVLSVVAAAIGNTRRVQLKRGWTEPSIIWTVIVGESGTLKTPAFRLVQKPIREIQAKALKEHEASIEEYEGTKLQYEKDLVAWKKSKDDNDPPEKPEPPQPARMVVSDTTVEAIAPLLLTNSRGLLLARDELSGWFGGFDRYSGGRGGGDAAHWLSMHAGESMLVDRKTGEPRTIHVPSASVSISGGIQPRILARALAVEYRENGLLARLLMACPPRRAKKWTDDDIPPEIEAQFASLIDRLLELRSNTFGGDDDDTEPVVVPFSTDAKSVLVDFINEHGEEQVDLSGDLAAAWSKLEGYAPRLALLIHFIRWAAGDPSLANPDVIDTESIAAGVKLTRWFGNEARRIYALLGESDNERERRRLIELIENKGGQVTVREWHRCRSHRTAEDAEAELAALVESGLGRFETASPGPKGGAPSKRFILTDVTDTDKTPDSSPEAGVLSVSEVSEGSKSQSDDDEGILI